MVAVVDTTIDHQFTWPASRPALSVHCIIRFEHYGTTIQNMHASVMHAPGPGLPSRSPRS
ncbi:hypothetical protein PAHAL_1G004600 [Panicum hallii]|uniref:Uncharacterized protein n=1 Tax=Panicum hallii TaxID=206008 RepID=A0A2T8KTG0_9POAL|nr:hypothetical protein PAHAL_1G004600 [Panicum hallii]